MTLLMLVSCDGSWSGMPCRGALSEDPPAENLAAKAVAAGWQIGTGRDLCPAHARLQVAADLTAMGIEVTR